MNVYENMRCVMEDNAHLISMVPVEELLRFGYEVGLKPGMKVLDLCCGYGTVKKVDDFERLIVMQNGTKMPMDDILNIEGEIFASLQ